MKTVYFSRGCNPDGLRQSASLCHSVELCGWSLLKVPLSYPLFKKKEKEKSLKKRKKEILKKILKKIFQQNNLKIPSTPCILLQCGQDETVTVILLVKADCQVSAGALHVGDRIVSIGNLPVTGLDEAAVKHVFSHLQGSLVNLQVSVMSRADPNTQVGDIVTFLLLLLLLLLSLVSPLSLCLCLCLSVCLSVSPSLPVFLVLFLRCILLCCSYLYCLAY